MGGLRQGRAAGFTPQFLIEEAQRLAHYPASRLENLLLREPVNLVQCKRQWTQALTEAKALFNQLPTEEVGYLYLDTKGQAVTPNPSAPDFSRLRRHYGSMRGTRPAIVA